MNNILEKLQKKLENCNAILINNKNSTNGSNLQWLNNFCAELFEFSDNFHKYLTLCVNGVIIEGNVNVEIIFLCLYQMVTCIKQLENTVRAEETSGTPIAAKQHFIERINWCLKRLHISLRVIVEDPIGSTHIPLEEHTFVELMDLVLKHLSIFSQEESCSNSSSCSSRSLDSVNLKEIKELRPMIDLLLSHVLAFANVALNADKKAITALCQRLLSECISFEVECTLDEEQPNYSNRKLIATSMENAIYNLESYINEALLRLVFTCFLDTEDISIANLRKTIRNTDPDDSSVYDLIDDFDANIDRMTQIGIFAIAFAPDVKTRTKVRSCLASLESLDAYIMPALQNSKSAAGIHSEILEQHYNEEVALFRHAIQEIIDSQAFISCYLEILEQCLTTVEKRFHKERLQEMAKMGEILYKHFTYEVNYNVLQQNAQKLQNLKKFLLILRECQAILMCADQVDSKRIIKRFKILRSVLAKFRDSFDRNIPATQQRINKSLLSIPKSYESNAVAVSSQQQLIHSIGITPSIRSILYNRNGNTSVQRRQNSVLAESTRAFQIKHPNQAGFQQRTNAENVRRKQSLRTLLFKRKQNDYLPVQSEFKSKNDKIDLTAIQISEILNQLNQSIISN